MAVPCRLTAGRGYANPYVLLELDSIQKRFGGVTALKNGTCTVKAGEVHLLMGENGAGKSTLMKIVAGMISPDAGEMRFRGPAGTLPQPGGIRRQRHRDGASGVAAGAASFGRRKYFSRTRRSSPAWLDQSPRYRSPRAPPHRASRFPFAGRGDGRQAQPGGQADGGNLPRRAAGLQPADLRRADLLAYRIAKRARCFASCRNCACAKWASFISPIVSKNCAPSAIASRFCATAKPFIRACSCDLTTDQLIQHMVGRAVNSLYTREPLAPGEEMLRVKGLTSEPLLKDISFTVRAGEIVGMAGLIGAGRTELCRALFGVDPIDAGEVQVGGKTVRIRSPRDAVRRRNRAGSGGPAADRAGRQPWYRAECHDGEPRRGQQHGISQIAQRTPADRRTGQATAPEIRFARAAGETVERRQSAKSGHREMAGDGRARHSVRRADARHRCRREDGGFSRRWTNWRARARRF